MSITIEHPNGYAGYMSGEHSLSIFNANGKEVFHTSSRAINTAEELYEMLEEFPEFLEEMNN